MKSKLLVLVMCAVAASVLIAAVAIASQHQGPDGPALAAQSDEELRQEAERATGKPGEVPPVCPREEVVAKLKEAGITFGPCLPIADDASDQERRAVLEKAAKANYGASEEAGAKPTDGCTVFSTRTSDGEIEGTLPCDEKVRDIRPVTRNGRRCEEVTTESETDPSQPAKTRTFCAEG